MKLSTVQKMTVLQGHTIPSAATTTTFSDSFNRANGSADGSTLDNGLGGNSTQTWTSHSGTWNIASNKLAQVAGGADRFLVVDSFPAADVQTVSIDYVGASTLDTGILARWTATGSDNGYMLYFVDANTMKLYKHDGGGFSQLAVNGAVTINANDTFTLSCSGTTISGLRNGVALASLTVTDSTYATGRPGLYAGGGGANTMDNFKVNL